MIDVNGLQSNNLGAFFDFLYEGLNGYVAIAELTRRPGHKDYMQHQFYMYPEQRNQMIDHVNRRTEQIDVYMTPSVFSAPVAKKEYFLASNVSWVEFDGNPNFASHKPSLRLQSSIFGKEHWYYRSTSPITDIQGLELQNRALAYTLGGDTGGWDAVQLLRPASGVNHKYPDKPRVTVLGCWDISYPPGLLSEGFVEPLRYEVNEGSLILPEIEWVLLKYQWPEKAASLLRMNTCPPGERSSSLMALGYWCGEIGMENAEILTVLLFADDKWGKFRDRPDRLKRLTDIVDVVRRKYPGNADNNGHKPINELILRGWSGILDFDVNFDWIIRDMFLDNTTLVLAGRPDVGKTQLSVRFGMNLALGKSEYLDFKIVRPRKMLWLSLELGIVPTKLLVQRMNKDVTDEERAILDEKFIVAPFGQAVHLNTPTGSDLINQVLDHVQPEGIILDSLGKAVTGGISKEEPIQATMEYLNGLNSAGCFVWGIHHLRKSDKNERKREPELDDLFGNQYIGAYARSVYALHDGSHGLELITLKQNFAAKPGYSTILERTENLDFVKGGTIDDEEKAQAQTKSQMWGE